MKYLIIENDVVVALAWTVPSSLPPGRRLLTWMGNVKVGDPSPDSPLAVAKRQKTAEMVAWRNQCLGGGYDTGFGFRLKCGEEDHAILSQYKVLLDEAVGRGLRTEDSMVSVYDIADVRWNLTVAQYTEMLLGYGAYCEEKYHQCLMLEHGSAEATTVEAVQAIQIPPAS